MIAHIVQKQSVMALCLVVLVGVAWVGCSTTATEQQQGQPVTGPPPEGTAAGAEVGRYYLDDVRVPSELNYDADDSILYETAHFKAGVLRFSKWRLGVPLLIEFFRYNMEKDQWTFVNAFKGKETLLSFSKPGKTCLIRITETWTGMTRVTIVVGPLGEKK
jgi:hypothetical protein